MWLMSIIAWQWRTMFTLRAKLRRSVLWYNVFFATRLGLVCLWLCLFVGLLPWQLKIACIDPHQTGFVGKHSDHLQLIKCWPSCVPGKRVYGGAKILAPPYYSQRAVLASLWALSSSTVFCILLTTALYHCSYQLHSYIFSVWLSVCVPLLLLIWRRNIIGMLLSHSYSRSTLQCNRVTWCQTQDWNYSQCNNSPAVTHTHMHCYLCMWLLVIVDDWSI